MNNNPYSNDIISVECLYNKGRLRGITGMIKIKLTHKQENLRTSYQLKYLKTLLLLVSDLKLEFRLCPDSTFLMINVCLAKLKYLKSITEKNVEVRLKLFKDLETKKLIYFIIDIKLNNLQAYYKTVRYLLSLKYFSFDIPKMLKRVSITQAYNRFLKGKL